MPIPIDLRHKAIILGVKIDDLPLSAVLNKIEQLVCSIKQLKIYTPNPEICWRAHKDQAFRRILNQADINIPDGFGLKLGAKVLGEKLKNRVTGVDLTAALLELAKNKDLKVYILRPNNSLTQSKDLAHLFSVGYPRLEYRTSTINTAQNLNDPNVLQDINKFQPQILFVTLGAVKQENWIHNNLAQLPSVKVALGVGGTFDFLTGQIKRAPQAFRKLGLEWLYRLYKEPRRIGRMKNATADFMLACGIWKKNMATRWRPNVVAIIKNKQGQFLLQKNARLKNHWQFVQGGVGDNESPEKAVLREIHEELGAPLQTLRLIRPLPGQSSYAWPRYAQLLRGYKGQIQRAFLVEFTGTDADFNFTRNNDAQEAEAIAWVDKKDILKKLYPARRRLAKKILEYI